MSDNDETGVPISKRIQALKKQRGSIKRQLTCFEKTLNTITADTDIETLDLESRFKEKHLPLQALFEACQGELEDLTCDDEEEDKNNERERSSFDERFYSISGRVKIFIKRGVCTHTPSIISLPSTSHPRVNSAINNHETVLPINNEFESGNAMNENSNTSIINLNNGLDRGTQFTNEISNHRAIRHNLPGLKIPTFSGRLDTWLGFYDSFTSMVHNHPDLPATEKFLYLKGCLTGDAANIVASLQTTHENYTVAWGLLKGRYHNSRFIIDSHVKALFELPLVSKEVSIRMLYDTTQKNLRALRALNVDVDKWDVMIIHLLKSKLNNYTIEKWEESVCDKTSLSLQDFLSFLQRRSQIEETRAAINQANNTIKSYNPKVAPISRQNSRSIHPFTGVTTSAAPNSNESQAKSVITKLSCYICKGEHGVFACSQFLNLSPKERYEAVRKVSLCVNCLRGTHHPKNCLSGGCRKCGKRHNSLLHFNRHDLERESQPEEPSQSNQSSSNPVSSYQLLIPSEVVLATAVVDIVDSQGKTHPCRVMLDSGSQPHVITEKFANKIKLKKVAVDIPLHSVDELSTNIKHITSATVRSRYNNLEHNLSLFVVAHISTTMPTIAIDRNSFTVPKDLFLADPEFHNPAAIDIILGAQYFYHFLCSGQITINNHPAVFQETELGWVVAGCFHQTHAKLGKMYCNFTKFSDLSLLWELDSGRESSRHSLEEEACESHYKKTTKRDQSGRYIVQLPFNKNKLKLGETCNTAFHRFHALETKFMKNPTLKSQYFECMQSYLKNGHMTLLEKDNFADQGFFLPHHAVVKMSSLTTKTRVVFDGSCKSSTGVSLNDALMVGPTIQEDLFSTFTRFRTFLFALTADIEQMYRQIQLCHEHRPYHKILWRENPNEQIQTYTLNTVTFGTASAPFLAIRTLHQLAEDEREKYPIAASIVKRDFYVDDLLTGANSFQEALSLRNDLVALLRKGGFNLRKWSSNDPRLITDLQTESQDSHMSLDPSETIKTLGLFWNPSKDSILYTVNLTESSNRVTKRSIFSQIAKLFDPLGLLGPVIVSAKIIIQNLWKTQLTWDEEVPTHLRESWLEYKNQLPLLNHIQFKRCISVPNQIELQVHGFCDASEKAYGACLYLRSSDTQGHFYSSLICSKSRVAPMKQISLPKLELCAALLLANLYTSTCKSLKVKIDKAHFWSDSTITLHWINTPSHTLNTFVANRVAEIQTLTDPCDWKHVPTFENPADLISRGQTPHQFLENKFWQHGPQWLCQRETTWPQMQCYQGEDPEKRKNLKQDAKNILSFKITLSTWNVLEKYSSLRTLNRVLAYCLRFIHNIRNKNKCNGPLSKNEIDSSHSLIIKLTQAAAFSKEIRNLSQGRAVSSESKLLSLNPFLDKDILKVGGRLKNARIPENQKHPIVLPRNHHITRLIIREEHIRKMHSGAQATLYGVRENYWPIDGRNVTRQVIRECIACFRARPRGVDYIMGNLPENRLFSTRPFLNVGVDYCGPFYIKEKRHRNRNKVKAYVSIFVCFASKAVHLELVSDLTTESFIGSLKRFFARRGKSETIYSDNAKNFVGARNEIKALYSFIQTTQRGSEVQKYLLNERVNWQFIPPRSPHFGGLWEASIKSFKHHLVRTVGDKLLTHEQLETYIIEIEAILNSRPLTPLSSDPNDLLPLTPGHLLIGSSLTSIPQIDLRDKPAGRLSSWQLAQQMRHHFWMRWQNEYLNQMTSRSKWQAATHQDSIEVGTLVVLHEDNLPPMSWKLGRIVELYPGQDKIVRVVLVRTNTGVYKRSLKRLYPLPILPLQGNMVEKN